MHKLAVSIALAMLACTTAVDDTAVEPGPSTLDRLQTRSTFMLWGDNLDATLTVRMQVGDQMIAYPSRLSLRGGYLTLVADPTGDVAVDVLDVYFDSLRAGDGGLPPTGLHLSDVHIYQEHANRCDYVEWSADGDTCEATVTTPLVLEATFHATDGVEVPIGPVDIGGMGTDLFVYRDLTTPEYPVLTTELRSLVPGTFSGPIHGFELADLVLAGHAHEMVPLSD